MRRFSGRSCWSCDADRSGRVRGCDKFLASAYEKLGNSVQWKVSSLAVNSEIRYTAFGTVAKVSFAHLNEVAIYPILEEAYALTIKKFQQPQPISDLDSD